MTEQSSSYVKFSVDGEIFEILKCTIEKYPNSKLAIMLSNRFPVEKTSDGCIKLCTNRKIFRYVAHWLRYGNVQYKNFADAAMTYDVAQELLLEHLMLNAYYWISNEINTQNAKCWLQTTRQLNINEYYEFPQIKLDINSLPEDIRSNRNKFIIFIHFPSNIIGKKSVDLIDQKDPNYYAICNSTDNIPEIIKETINFPIDMQNMFLFTKRTNDTRRPRQIDYTKLLNLPKSYYRSSENIQIMDFLYLPINNKQQIVIFIKLATNDDKNNLMSKERVVVGTLFVFPNDILNDKLIEISNMCSKYIGNNVSVTALYEEIRIEPMYRADHLNLNMSFSALQIGNGDILIAKIS